MADQFNPNESSANDAYATAIALQKQQELIDSFNKKINSDFTGLLNGKKELIEIENNHFKRQLEIDKLEKENNLELAAIYKKILDTDKETLNLQKEQLKNVNLLKLGMQSYLTYSVRPFLTLLGDAVEYINKADGAFKDLSKTIGLSSAQSDILRNNLIRASESAASIGINFEELAKIQGSYTNELGTAVLLSSQSLDNIAQIAAGTNLGAENAGTMVAKFNDMGKSTESVRNFIQDTVNQSAKFGVSSSAVLKKINDNLDKSQKYVFKGGIDGLAKMAMYATKFNIDMGSVFAAIDNSRSLEGAVSAASQLQVLGGKFAQVDPFKLLFQARNDAEGFTHTIQDMTKGMYNWNKTTGKLEITAGDFDRLKLAAEATKVPIDELAKQAQRGAQVSMIDKIIGGSMTKAQREFIEGVAEIQKDGSFTITMPDGKLKDIRDISGDMVDKMSESNKSLQERAKDAMTFDKLLVNTLNELKSDLLPILSFLDKAITGLNNSKILKPLMEFGIGALALGGITNGIISAGKTFGNILSILGIGGKNIISKIIGGSQNELKDTMTKKNVNDLGISMKSAGESAGGAWKNVLAFGAAAIGVGAGIWLAAEGVAALATSFKGLNTAQIVGVDIAIGTLGLTFAGMAYILANASPELIAASSGLYAFGGAVALIGAGVGIAAAGIGYMAKGFGELFEGLAKASDPKLSEGLFKLMLALGGLSGEALLFANPLTWVGLKLLTNGIEDIGDKLKDVNFDKVNIGASSFDNIANAIDRIDEKKLDKLIKASENLGTIGSIAALIGNLTNSFGDGIEVKFSKDKINLEVNVTAEMDGQKIGRMVSKDVALSLENSKKGTVK